MTEHVRDHPPPRPRCDGVQTTRSRKIITYKSGAADFYAVRPLFTARFLPARLPLPGTPPVELLAQRVSLPSVFNRTTGSARLLLYFSTGSAANFKQSSHRRVCDRTFSPSKFECKSLPGWKFRDWPSAFFTTSSVFLPVGGVRERIAGRATFASSFRRASSRQTDCLREERSS